MANEQPRKDRNRDASARGDDRVTEGHFGQGRPESGNDSDIGREGDAHGSGAERRSTQARQGTVIHRRPMTRVLIAGIMLVVLGFALAALLVFGGIGAPTE